LPVKQKILHCGSQEGKAVSIYCLPQSILFQRKFLVEVCDGNSNRLVNIAGIH
jgi:hypothetical protein